MSRKASALAPIFLAALPAISCKSGGCAELWLSTDQNLYVGTTIEISADGNAVLSNLPQDGLSVLGDDLQGTFDTKTKVGRIDGAKRRISFENRRKESFADIIFATQAEMDIIFEDGTECHFVKK